LRGVASLELKVTGPKMDLHSGIYGGAVMNPLTAMARLLATLHDANGRVAIPGFYDDVLPLENWEREMWRKIPLNADEEIVKRDWCAGIVWRKGFFDAGTHLGATDGGDQRLRGRLPRAGNQDSDRTRGHGKAYLPSRSESGWQARSTPWRKNICKRTVRLA
jgi:acetylornithine deacetylase/succinyl-diaminopimelate desuccinylase-like protein